MNESIDIEPLIRPVSKTVAIPGSKSITNRALIIAALSGKKCEIKNPLISDDTKAMISCLKKLNVKIQIKENKITLNGFSSKKTTKKYTLNADLSGTTLRFLLPFLTIIPGTKVLRGKDGLNNRPIGDLVDALVSMGAEIEYLAKEGYPPLVIKSGKIKKKFAKVSGKMSSQYLSALLIILPVIGGGIIEVEGNLVSKPYIDLTIEVMHKFGAEVTNNNYSLFTVKNVSYKETEFSVEGDYSSASYFAAIAALTGSEMKLNNLNPESNQGDMRFLEVLESMGNIISEDENSVTIKGSGVSPVVVDMEHCPDQIQTLAVLAAFAKGKTVISGIQTLKVKETDRILAIREELNEMGIKTELNENSLIIYGGNPRGAEIDTYGDHRMAMSFAIAGVKIPGIKINNPQVVTKTYPGFWDALESINSPEGGKNDLETI